MYISQLINSIHRECDTKKIMEILEQLDEKVSRRARKARLRHLPHNNVVRSAHTPYRARQLQQQNLPVNEPLASGMVGVFLEAKAQKIVEG